jgi:hypothetical protein
MKRRTGKRSWHRHRFVGAALIALASSASTSAGFSEQPKPRQIVCLVLATVLAYLAVIEGDQARRGVKKKIVSLFNNPYGRAAMIDKTPLRWNSWLLKKTTSIYECNY